MYVYMYLYMEGHWSLEANAHRVVSEPRRLGSDAFSTSHRYCANILQ